MHTTYTFGEVSLKRTIKIECSGCGKKLKRVLTEFQTLNPYNKNSKGEVKSAGEIRSELPGELDKEEKRMRKAGIQCRACENAA